MLPDPNYVGMGTYSDLMFVFIFVEPGAQAVQEGGDGDVQMTAVNGDIADGASGGKDEEMEEGELQIKPWF